MYKSKTRILEFVPSNSASVTLFSRQPARTFLLNPCTQLAPYPLLLLERRGSRKPTGTRSNKHSSALPIRRGDHTLGHIFSIVLSAQTAHPLILILPAVLELVLPDPPTVPYPPDRLPYALADDAGDLGPPSPNLVLQDGHARVELLLGELSAVAAGAGDDIGEAKVRQRRVLSSPAEAGGDVGAVQQPPKQVGRVSVGMTCPRRLDTRVEPNKEHKHFRVESICEGCEVGIR